MDPWYLSQRVVGCVEDQGLGTRCELAGQFCRVQLPVIAGFQLSLSNRALQEEGERQQELSPDSSSCPDVSASISLLSALDSTPTPLPLSHVPGSSPSHIFIPQPTHNHPALLTSLEQPVTTKNPLTALAGPLTTQNPLPASGTQTQADLQPSESWVRNNQRQAR